MHLMISKCIAGLSELDELAIPPALRQQLPTLPLKSERANPSKKRGADGEAGAGPASKRRAVGDGAGARSSASAGLSAAHRTSRGAGSAVGWREKSG